MSTRVAAGTRAATTAFDGVVASLALFAETVTVVSSPHLSAPVAVMDLLFDPAIREIRVSCSDGETRCCRLKGFSDLETARLLWKRLQLIQKHGWLVTFEAKAGWSSDQWFNKVSLA